MGIVGKGGPYRVIKSLLGFVFYDTGHGYLDDVLSVEQFLGEGFHVVDGDAVERLFVVGVVLRMISLQ